jgi:flagellar basal-body rod modification protein FlgD
MISWHSKKRAKGVHIMQVDSTSSGGALQNGGTIKSATQQGQLGMSDFFTLMAAQLQNQDPSNPTDSSQFMGQMAQFGSLEQLTSISSSLSFAQAANVVGKNVEISHANTQTGKTETTTGLVSSVDVSGTSPTCQVNGNWYSISDIAEISSAPASSTTSGTESNSTDLADMANISQLSALSDAVQSMSSDSSDSSQNTQDSLYGDSISNTPML